RAPLSRVRAVFVPRSLLLAGAANAPPAPSPPESTAERINGHAARGEVVPSGHGTARTWVRLDEADQPVSLGVTLTEAALEGVPPRATPGVIWMVEYIIQFPSDIPLLPFNHAGINWNPHGHPPGAIYDTPHFDFQD